MNRQLIQDGGASNASAQLNQPSPPSNFQDNLRSSPPPPTQDGGQNTTHQQQPSIQNPPTGNLPNTAVSSGLAASSGLGSLSSPVDFSDPAQVASLHPNSLSQKRGISIEWQELFPIYLACILWGPCWSGKRIRMWCDNKSVVASINSKHSKSPRVMDLIRAITLQTLQYNFAFTATHIPGLDNSIADSLSRFQMDRFRTLAPSASPTASTIPPSAMNI